jgi:hypothetical protein
MSGREEVESQPSGFQLEVLNGRYLAGDWFYGVDESASGDAVAAASGSDAILDYPAVPGRRHVFFGVAWDYATTPTAGEVVVESPSGVPLFRQDVTAAGLDSVPFPMGLKGPVGAHARVVLKNGFVAKKISLLGRRAE